MKRRGFLIGLMGVPILVDNAWTVENDGSSQNVSSQNAPSENVPSQSVPSRIVEREFVAKYDGALQRFLLRYPVEPVERTPEQSVNSRETIDLLVALHGHGADRNQFMYDARDECRATREIADQYGMLMVSPDYRAATSWMGPAAMADVVQILEILRAEFSIRHTILAGGSMGASSALTFAAIRPELVDGVVAMNGLANHLEYEQFQDAIAESFGGDKRTIPEEYKKRSAEYFPEKLTMPIAVTTGGNDTLVPPESVTRLVAILTKLGRPVVQIHRPNGGHETNAEDAMAAFKAVLQELEKKTEEKQEE